jgi:hypothetical protein
MANPPRDFEADLERLGHYIRRGQAALEPLSPKELKVVRDAVRRQWELEHGQTQAQQKPQQPPQAQSIPKQKTPPHGHDKGQSHGHGHSH